MADTLSITAKWEALEAGAAEDRATFSEIGVAYNDIWLTEADDAFVGRVRQRVHLSAYRMAEWFVWNWWRLRWEPRGTSIDWRLAHKMTTIGGGYVWPNITFISDGERVVVDAQPTEPRSSEPLRYIANFIGVVPAREFEKAVETFVQLVCAKLVDDRIEGSNLEVTWRELLAERADPELAKRRKLEALLGFDTDQADEATIERLILEALQLGESAVQELAANATEAAPPSLEDITTWADECGVDWHPRDAIQLADKSKHALPTNVAAWKRGAAAARALREQERLGGSLIPNERLCEFAGAARNTIESANKPLPISFASDGVLGGARVALKSRHASSRRFHLARLLGDRIASSTPGRLLPATDAITYRQKVQRSFAAELLCPFDYLVDMLRGDFTEDAVVDAADHFAVSPWAVRTILANHGLIERDDITATA